MTIRQWRRYSAATAPVAVQHGGPSIVLHDRFTNIIEKRRAAVRKNEAATGIDEEYGHGEQLMDDLLLEINEEAQRKKALLEERNELENLLLAAGEEMRSVAVAGKRKKGFSPKKSGNKTGWGETLFTPKKRKRPSAADTDDDEREVIRREVKRREEQEEKRLATEREKLELAKQRLEIGETRVMARMNLEKAFTVVRRERKTS